MITTASLRRMLQLRHEPIAFTSLERAIDYVARCECPMRAVLGDIDEASEEGVVWVVPPADAAKLERAGYEIA